MSTLPNITGNLVRCAYYVESTFKEVVANPTWLAFGRSAKVSNYRRTNNMGQIKDLGVRCPTGFSTGKYEVAFSIETDAIKDLNFLEAILGAVKTYSIPGVVGDAYKEVEYVAKPVHKSLTIILAEDIDYNSAAPEVAEKYTLIKGVIIKNATITIENEGLLHFNLECVGTEDPTTKSATLTMPSVTTDDIYNFAECVLSDTNSLLGICERMEISLQNGSEYNFGIGNRRGQSVKTGGLSVQVKVVNVYDPSKATGFENYTYGAAGALDPEDYKVASAGQITLHCGHETGTGARKAIEFVLPNFHIFEYSKTGIEYGQQVMEEIEGECTGITVYRYGTH